MEAFPGNVHTKPDGFISACALEYLNQDNASDEDLVVFYPTATFLHWLCHEEKLCKERYEAIEAHCTYTQMYYRIKSITVAEVPVSYTGQPTMSRLWGIDEFHVSAF